MTPISAVLITLNEEPRLAAALESVRFCDEVLVVDAGSTDRTREIAAAAGARVETRAWDGFTSQRNHAAAMARHEWSIRLRLPAGEVGAVVGHDDPEHIQAREPSFTGFDPPAHSGHASAE